MYNPLRPHIVEFANGNFAIRKFVVPWGWMYYDNQRYGSDQYWWTFTKHSAWFLIPTLDKAQDILHIMQNSPLNIKKVHYES
jgi:hypothetical protein